MKFLMSTFSLFILMTLASQAYSASYYSPSQDLNLDCTYCYPLADALDLPNASLETEIASLNSLAGTGFSAYQATKVEDPNFTAFIVNGYFWVKEKEYTWFFNAPQADQVTLDKYVSHIGNVSAVISVNEVPLPGTLGLLGVGLAGLGLIRRSKS